jgi:hypothetical protein
MKDTSFIICIAYEKCEEEEGGGDRGKKLYLWGVSFTPFRPQGNIVFRGIYDYTRIGQRSGNGRKR